jgi:hypothetical protein
MKRMRKLIDGRVVGADNRVFGSVGWETDDREGCEKNAKTSSERCDDARSGQAYWRCADDRITCP